MNNNRMLGSGLRKITLVSLTLALSAGMLAACSSGSNESVEKRVLRIGVLYGGSDNEPYFRQQFTDMYEMSHPNIEFQIVGAINYEDQRFEQQDSAKPTTQPDPYEKMKEMLDGANPVDVVVLDYNMLRRFTQDNLLQPLDPLIAQDKFDLSDYVPTVIDGIKSAGDGNLYALTPTFSSSALFYNKKLFADANVTPPTNKMQWSEVLNVARQVSQGNGEDRKFGFSFNRWSSDSFNNMTIYSQALNLKMFDDNAEKMLVNSDQWEEVWSTIASLDKEQVTPNQEFINKMYEKQSAGGGNDPFYGDLFIKGKVAMTIGDYGYINELRRASDNASKIKDFEMVDWDVVTVPVSPTDPDVGGNISLSQLMGINSKAQNDKDAWDFIKYSNSKEWAKLKSRSLYEMVARKEFLAPIGGMQYNIDAFTTLKPILPSSTGKDNRENPAFWEAQQPAYELMQQVIKGDKTAREALAEWETKGNAVLERIKNNAAGEGGTDGGGGTIDIMPLPR